jgi:hypothetical protein
MPVPDPQKGMEHSVALASLVPLPRALSLVVIEPQDASPHTRGDKHGSKKMLEKLYKLAHSRVGYARTSGPYLI